MIAFDWRIILGLLAGATQLYSIVPYIRDMLHGETRPNITSWALWTLIQVIIIAAQFSAGASWSIVIPIAMTISTCLVIVLCLFGYGYRSYGVVDILCFIMTIVAIIVWRLTNDPVLAILMSIVADFIAALPTYIKTYKEPFSESMISWTLVLLANALALASAAPFNLANTAFSSYVLAVDAIFVIAMIFRRGIVRK